MKRVNATTNADDAIKAAKQIVDGAKTQAFETPSITEIQPIAQTVVDGVQFPRDETLPETYETRIQAEISKYRNGLTGVDIVPSPEGGGFMFRPILETPTDEQRAAAERDTGVLNSYLQEYGQLPVKAVHDAPAGGLGSDVRLSQAIGEIFGNRPIIVSANNTFEGAAYNGKSYITEDAPYGGLSVVLHEASHQLEKSNPELFERIRTSVLPLLRDGAVEARRQEEQKNRTETEKSTLPEVSTDKGERETMADISGALVLDPQFWREMKQ